MGLVLVFLVPKLVAIRNPGLIVQFVPIEAWGGVNILPKCGIYRPGPKTLGYM